MSTHPAGGTASCTATTRTAWVAQSDPPVARSIAHDLTQRGWRVDLVACDTASISRHLDDGTLLPDVLVSSLRFDDGDGFQLIRQLARHRRAPALFIASRQQRSVIRAAVALADACAVQVAGCAEHPFDAAAIARSLGQFQRRAAAPGARAASPVLERQALLAMLEQDALGPWMQPKVRLSSNEVVGFEALMRAHDDSGALIMPDRLIPALAAHGLLEHATLRMAEKTAGFVASCLGEGMAVSASINVSMQSLSNFSFCQALAHAVEKLQLDPSWLTIEITETDAMADLPSVIENTGRIRMHGFNLAIDDFGTAYSSLSQLSQIPFSELKIERAFITAVDRDRGKQAIVQACLQLARSLDLHVVAEGVETPSELGFLRQAGCDQIQGYLVSRPVPAARALDWLRGLDDLRIDLPA